MAKGFSGGKRNSMVSAIAAIIARGEYEYYGIRVDDGVSYSVGDNVANSRIWEDGEPTGEELDGASAVGLKLNSSAADIARAVAISQNYFGDSVYLIGGYDMEYGEDAGEYVIKDAVVVKVLKKRKATS